jgi:hypothetical protein
MAPFTLRVTFTGLCGFVENENKNDPTPLCAVLVNGTRPATDRNFRALDDTPLRFHRPFVTFPIPSVQPAPDDVLDQPMTHGIWYLNRERLHFEIPPSEVAANRLDIQRLDLRGNPHPEEPNMTNREHRESYTWIADLRQVVAAEHTLDCQIVASTGVIPPSVIGQVLIPGGRLRPALFTRAVWEFANTLSGPGPGYTPRVFAHEVSFTWDNLTQAALVSQPLDATRPVRRLSLTPAEGTTLVRVRIANLCDTNPLGWLLPREPEADRDMKWFYELLSAPAKQSIRDILARERKTLPIPEVRRMATSVSGIHSGNCIPPLIGQCRFHF